MISTPEEAVENDQINEEMEFLAGLGVPEDQLAGSTEDPGEAPAEEVEAASAEAPSDDGPEDTRSVEELRAEIERLEKHERGLRANMIQERENARHRFDQRFNELQALLEARNQPEPPPLSEDPLERLEQKLDGFEQREQLAQQHQAEREEFERQRDQYNRIAQAAAASEVTFKESHPDYEDAFRFGQERLTAYFRTQGVPEENLNAAFQQELLRLSANALARNQSPAQVLYDQCRAFGWNPPAPEQPVEEAPPAPEAAAPQPVQRQAPASLTSMPRTSGSTQPPIDDLLADPQAMAKIVNDDKKFQELLGRIERIA